MDKPHIKLVVLNETAYWNADVVEACGGAIFQAYLYDANRVVHCCELTPSYELHPLYACAVTVVDDKTHEILLSNQEHEVRYYHCRGIDRLPADHVYDAGEFLVDPYDGYDALIEQQIENYRANVMLEAPAWPPVALAA